VEIQSFWDFVTRHIGLENSHEYFKTG